MEILRKIDLFQKEINALEGNSLTESETKVLLEDGLTVGGKPLRDVRVLITQGHSIPWLPRRRCKRRWTGCLSGYGRNGRVARLTMNLALIQDRYLPAVVPPILRGDYVSLLERAHRDDGDFVEFIAEREFESQKEILRLFQIPFPKEGQGTGQSPAMQ